MRPPRFLATATALLCAGTTFLHARTSQAFQLTPMEMLSRGDCPARALNATGKWLGTLPIGQRKLRMAFEIATTKEGGYTALLHNIDRGTMNIPLDSVTVTGDKLRLELKDIGFAFEAQLQPGGTELRGKWLQAGEWTPMVMQRVETVPELYRFQNPKLPYPYGSMDVSFQNPAAGVQLAGTLTIPMGKGPFPAVMLIGGSGPSERDEAVRGHKPFLVLADHLTRQGIAVLRMDKRGCGKSTGVYPQGNLNEFVSDVLAGISFLKKRPEVDGLKIGLIGHSEGGEVAPMAAVQSRDVAYLALLAAPGLSFYDSMVLQDGTEAKAAGASDQAVELIRSFSRSYYRIILNATTADEVAQKTKLLHAALTEPTKKALAVFGWPDLEGTLSPSWGLLPESRRQLAFDIRPTLRRIACPILVLSGDKDCQVPSKENLNAIEQELRAGNNKDHTILEIPGMNHLFQTCKTGAVSEYLTIDETMSPLVLDTISRWINAHTKP